MLYVCGVVPKFRDFTPPDDRINLVYYVYILQSLKDKSLYVGYSSDLKKRLKKHNLGRAVSTKDKIPLKIIYYEAYLDRKDAIGREKFLKSGAGWRFIKKQLKNYLGKYGH